MKGEEQPGKPHTQGVRVPGDHPKEQPLQHQERPMTKSERISRELVGGSTTIGAQRGGCFYQTQASEGMARRKPVDRWQNPAEADTQEQNLGPRTDRMR